MGLEAGTTSGAASAGATMVGVGAGTSSGGPGGGSTTSSPPPGGLSAWLLAAGGTNFGTAAGLGGLAGVLPNGGASLPEGLAGEPTPVHAHTDDPSGGVIDYLRLVVSTTAPAPPVSPSDAFWLNPLEVA